MVDSNVNLGKVNSFCNSDIEYSQHPKTKNTQVQLTQPNNVVGDRGTFQLDQFNTSNNSKPTQPEKSKIEQVKNSYNNYANCGIYFTDDHYVCIVLLHGEKRRGGRRQR